MKVFHLILSLLTIHCGAYADFFDCCDGIRGYIRAGAGFSFVHDHLDDIAVKYKTGFSANAALGHYVTPWLRIEGEWLYLNNHIRDIRIGGIESTGQHGSVRNNTAFANLLFELPSCYVQPYVGGGYGYGHEVVTLKADGFDTITDRENRWVYQAIAGVSIPIYIYWETEVCVTLECRYFVFDKHARAGLGLAGLILKF